MRCVTHPLIVLFACINEYYRSPFTQIPIEYTSLIDNYFDGYVELTRMMFTAFDVLITKKEQEWFPKALRDEDVSGWVKENIIVKKVKV